MVDALNVRPAWLDQLDGTPHEALHALLTHVQVASLGTILDGEPLVSLVPFAVLPHPLRFVLLVSDLAVHTRALRNSARCSLLIHEPDEITFGRNPNALVRVSMMADAAFLDRDRATNEGALAVYERRFATAKLMLTLSDFHCVVVRPIGANLVQGFGRAWRVTGEELSVFEHRTKGT